jgi:5-formyltetrahydrofolate cyclo-ligase
VAQTKAALRSRLLAERAAMDPARRLGESELATSAVLDTWVVGAGDLVAGYASFGTEPDTESLRRALAERGAAVLLPVVLADHDLSWRTESGEDLGRDAIAGCALVVVPGLAADRDGWRLGRGGGSYDRALSRVGDGVPRVLLAYASELLDAVPHEGHDERVTHVAIAGGVLATSAWLAP